MRRPQWNQCSRCRLLLVGRVPTQAMLDAAKRDSGIIVTGAVPDVRPYLAAASVMVVPLLQGGGTRFKILEAFAALCPVVSTAKGAEGLRVRDGEHLLIRDSVEEIIGGVCHLWSEPSLGEKLAHAAYELVQAIGEKLSLCAICQGVIEKKLGTTSLPVRKRGYNQLNCRFSLCFDNS